MQQQTRQLQNLKRIFKQTCKKKKIEVNITSAALPQLVKELRLRNKKQLPGYRDSRNAPPYHNVIPID